MRSCHGVPQFIVLVYVCPSSILHHSSKSVRRVICDTDFGSLLYFNLKRPERGGGGWPPNPPCLDPLLLPIFYLIIQHIVTLPEYGHGALNIRRP